MRRRRDIMMSSRLSGFIIMNAIERDQLFGAAQVM